MPAGESISCGYSERVQPGDIKRHGWNERRVPTYVDVLRQQLIRHPVLVHDVVVHGPARAHRAEQEAKHPVNPQQRQRIQLLQRCLAHALHSQPYCPNRPTTQSVHRALSHYSSSPYSHRTSSPHCPHTKYIRSISACSSPPATQPKNRTHPPLKAPTGLLAGSAFTGVSIKLLVVWKLRVTRRAGDAAALRASRARLVGRRIREAIVWIAMTGAWSGREGACGVMAVGGSGGMDCLKTCGGCSGGQSSKPVITRWWSG